MPILDYISNRIRKFRDRILDFAGILRQVGGVTYDASHITEAAKAFPAEMTHSQKQQVESVINNILKAYNTANEKEFSIAVIGDFSVGKSSFINALLGVNVVKVAANQCTAVITKIRYGKPTKAIVSYLDGNDRELSAEEFLTFSSYSLDDFQQRRNDMQSTRLHDVKDAKLYVDSDFLKRGKLCLVDTLGLNADNIDNDLTKEAAKNAIAVIYMCSERGLSSNDIKFIDDNIDLRRNDCFLCINRIDLLSKKERPQVVEGVKLKLDALLKEKGVSEGFPEDRIYPVSSLYKLFANGYNRDDENYDPNRDYSQLSGFELIMTDLITYVRDNADSARRRLINASLEKERTVLQTLRETWRLEYEAEKSSCNSIISGLNTQISNLRRQIKTIESLFDNLYLNIKNRTDSLHTNYLTLAEKDWPANEARLANSFKYSPGKLITLKENLLGINLRRFGSPKPSDYLVLNVKPAVDAVVTYLSDRLSMEVQCLNNEICSIINAFASNHGYSDLFNLTDIYTNIPTYAVKPISLFADPASDPNLLKEPEETYEPVLASMYRGAAAGATESTFVMASTRKASMVRGAKEAALKNIKSPLKQALSESLQTIRKYIDTIEAKATSSLTASLNRNLHSLEEEQRKLDKLTKAQNAVSAFLKKLESNLILKEAVKK